MQTVRLRVSSIGCVAWGVLLLLIGCSPDRPPSVLIVTWDTVRADALESQGGTAPVPTFDRIAREGARFTEAISPCPITLPAHATIWTGRFPISHGIHNNGVSVLADEAETLAEILQKRGYWTSAVIGALPLASDYGLDQGFDVYDDEWSENEAPFPFEYHQRRATEVTDAALRALTMPAESGVPFLQWVHYYDPHFGYLPPPPFDETYRDDPYAGEIAYTDRELGRIIDQLESWQRLDDTIVIITSDHGEALGEHGEAYHGSLIYDATQRVPLAIRWPAGIPAGRILDGQVTLADLFPTVLDLLGLPAGSAVQGRSLAGWLAGGAPAITPFVYLEAAMLSALFNTTPARGMRSSSWKYVHHREAPEVYDLALDVGETVDLGRADSSRSEKLEETYRSLVASLRTPSTSAQDRPLSSSEQEALRRLGYLGGKSSRPLDWEPDRELDPRPYVADVGRQLMQEEMLAFLERGRLDLARWQLDRLPAGGGGAFLRALYHERVEESELAIAAYEEALRLGVEASPPFAGGSTWTRGARLLDIAEGLKRLGQRESASRAYRQASAELDRPELLVAAAEGLPEGEARPILEIAARYRRPAVSVALAEHWERHQDVVRAGELLREAEAKWPQDLEVVLARAGWEARHGEVETARGLLRRAAALPGGASRASALERQLR